MLNLVEIVTKLYQLPRKFEEAQTAGRWCEAASAYEKAVVISRFVGMDVEARDKLLNRFDPDAVKQVFKDAGRYEEVADADRGADRKQAV